MKKTGIGKNTLKVTVPGTQEPRGKCWDGEWEPDPAGSVGLYVLLNLHLKKI